MIEECKHKNTLDPNTISDPELRVLWCRDCGALLFPGGRVQLPKTFKHVFACPMCGQEPTATPNYNPFMAGSTDYSCAVCGFKIDPGKKYEAATLERWNKAVWEIITGDVVELRKRYQEIVNELMGRANSANL